MSLPAADVIAVFVNSASPPVLYFGHAESVAPVLVALGLYRDHEPLRADMFNKPSVADERKFRTSSFMPFSANVALVLHDCAEDRGLGARMKQSNMFDQLLDEGRENFVGNVSATDRFFVQLLVNERPMKFPLSSSCGRSLCSYSKLREYLSPYVDRCRFDKMCQLPTNT